MAKKPKIPTDYYKQAYPAIDDTLGMGMTNMQNRTMGLTNTLQGDGYVNKL